MRSLELKHSRDLLNPIGKLFYDDRELTIWERETMTLPKHLQRKRAKYRKFAREFLAPIYIRVDQNPDDYDKTQLYVAAGRMGLQTELLPWPLGTLDYHTLINYVVFSAVLKAEELSAACGGLALALLGHDLGVAPIFLSGKIGAVFRWQWAMYRQIRAGKPVVAAFAITEPDAGSDVEDSEGAKKAKLITRVEKTKGGYILNGTKQFITNGGIADYVTVFAAIGKGGVETWTCFMVEKGMKGFSVGRREKKMGQKASDASELIFEDVFIPDRNRIGEEGTGWAINRNVLNFSRGPVGAIALGIARGALEAVTDFVRKASLGNRPLISYQEIQLALADMMIDIMATRAMVWQSTRYRFPFQTAASAAKVFASDMAFSICNRAMEIMGDHGYLTKNTAEKTMRDARLTQIYEGTNQINRLAIIESQLNLELQMHETKEDS